jgi:Na+/proline symporter
MRILYLIIVLIFLCPVVSYAEVSPQDLLSFSTNLSSIVSFFAGCLAIIAFVFGVNGGKGV